MPFQIQLGHIKIQQDANAEALASLFRQSDESLYIFWQDIPIRFRYRQDLVPRLNQLLVMLSALLIENEGQTRVELSNQLLKMSWALSWQTEQLFIKANFYSKEPLYFDYANALQRKGEVSITKTAFLNEWKALLSQLLAVFNATAKAGISIREQKKWQLLKELEPQIPQYGTLYTN